MGRPPKKPEDKRVQVNIRLLAKDRDRLQEIANESEKPLATEAENILAAYLNRSPETNALLDRIASEIERLEAFAKGRWHKNLMAWAAVSEMLSKIVEDDRPERIADDEAVQEIRARMKPVEDLRYAIVSLLAREGVSVKVDPRPEPYLGDRRRGIFGLRPQQSIPSRVWERAAIEAMPDGLTKDKCLGLFEILESKDREIAEMELAESAAMQPYIEAEQAGRRLVTPPNALLAYWDAASEAAKDTIKKFLESQSAKQDAD